MSAILAKSRQAPGARLGLLPFLIVGAAMMCGCEGPLPFDRAWTVRDMQRFFARAKVEGVEVTLYLDRTPVNEPERWDELVYFGPPADPESAAAEIVAALREDSEAVYYAEASEWQTGVVDMGFISFKTESVSLRIDLVEKGFWVGHSNFMHSAFRNDKLRDIVIRVAKAAEGRRPRGVRYELFVPLPPPEPYYWSTKEFPYEPPKPLEDDDVGESY